MQVPKRPIHTSSLPLPGQLVLALQVVITIAIRITIIVIIIAIGIAIIGTIIAIGITIIVSMNTIINWNHSSIMPLFNINF